MQKTNGSLIFEFPSGCNLNNSLFKMLAAAWNMISGGGQYLASVSELAKNNRVSDKGAVDIFPPGFF